MLAVNDLAQYYGFLFVLKSNGASTIGAFSTIYSYNDTPIT